MRSLAYYLVASISSIIDAHDGNIENLRAAAKNAHDMAARYRDLDVTSAAFEWNHAALKIDAAVNHLATLMAA